MTQPTQIKTKITGFSPIPTEKPIGKYGIMYRNHLKAHRIGLYTALFVNGTLYDHMRDIDDQANKLIDVLLPKYKAMYEVTEQLKAEDQLEWVRRMNTIMHQIDEITLNDIVYS